MTHAIFVSRSKNAKTGDVSATYASIAATCPESCALRGQGCYAQGGRVGITVRKLDACEDQPSPEDVARMEAAAIDGAFPRGMPRGRALRIHVSGDCRTRRAAWLLGQACRRWFQRGGSRPWTYTHAWQSVHRLFWTNFVSVLASIDDVKDATRAWLQGYAPARYVSSYPAGDRAWKEQGFRWIPCPATTRGVTCVDCRLCLNADALHARGAGIAFAVHGEKAGALRRRLAVL